MSDFASPRAGFWRRLFALAFDEVVVLILAPTLFAFLFPLSGGALQWRESALSECTELDPSGPEHRAGAEDDDAYQFNVGYCFCASAVALPEGIAPSIAENAKLKLCRASLYNWKNGHSSGYGWPTAAWLSVIRDDNKGEPQTYALAPNGRAVRSVDFSAFWGAILLAYLIAAAALRGRSFGGMLFGARLVRRDAPQARGVGWLTAIRRYAALAVAFLPFALLKLAEPLPRSWIALGVISLLFPLAWLGTHVVFVATRRDSLADRFAGTIKVEG